MHFMKVYVCCNMLQLPCGINFGSIVYNLLLFVIIYQAACHQEDKVV